MLPVARTRFVAADALLFSCLRHLFALCFDASSCHRSLHTPFETFHQFYCLF
jgi:hypothetical protein